MEIEWIKDVQYFEELPSTQDCALNLARNGAQEGTLVIAKKQIQGRGRKTNLWFSPPGGLWFSLILKPGMVPFYIPTLNLGTSLAVIKGIRKITGMDVSIRWPNDIYCRVGLNDNEKKLGGIIVEMEAKGDFLEFVVAGVGLNTNVNMDDFPYEIRERAISVLSETGREIDNFALLEEILREFGNVYAAFKRDGFKPILKEIKENCSLLGRRVWINEDSSLPVEGQALDIDESGALLVRLDCGAVTRILSGRVKVL